MLDISAVTVCGIPTKFCGTRYYPRVRILYLSFGKRVRFHRGCLRGGGVVEFYMMDYLKVRVDGSDVGRVLIVVTG